MKRVTRPVASLYRQKSLLGKNFSPSILCFFPYLPYSLPFTESLALRASDCKYGNVFCFLFWLPELFFEKKTGTTSSREMSSNLIWEIEPLTRERFNFTLHLKYIPSHEREVNKEPKKIAMVKKGEMKWENKKSWPFSLLCSRPNFTNLKYGILGSSGGDSVSFHVNMAEWGDLGAESCSVVDEFLRLVQVRLLDNGQWNQRIVRMPCVFPKRILTTR